MQAGETGFRTVTQWSSIMLKKHHALLVASLIGIGAFAMPAATASAGALVPMQQNSIHMTNDNPLLVEVKKDRDGKRHWRRHGGHKNWSHHRKWRRHHHDRDHFALYINPFFFNGYSYYDDDWCYRRYGYYSWRCRY
ncbi:MAG: hypothetical protein ACREDU_10085 [Methylocella sp.]